MIVIVNGHRQPLPEPQTVEALLIALTPAAPFAVALNGEFVQRATYKECRIQSGDRIEILHPTVGG